MFFKKIKLLTNEINKLSKKEKKHRAFIISNTADKKLEKYLTPLRKSPRCVYGGAVVYDDITTKKICKLISEKVDYVFVDTEKKAFMKKNKGAINIERTVRENINLDKIFYFKANDLTVDATSNFMELLFAEDIRNISNKKMLIIGAGNIGFKLSLKFIERGAKVFLLGKHKKNVKKFISVINSIKPRATMNNIKYVEKIKKDLTSFDVIINASNSSNKILKQDEIKLKKNVIFLEVGKNLFSKKVLKIFLNKTNIRIFRLDVSNAFNELIEQKINNRNQWKKKKFIRVKIGNLNLITVGLLGRKDDIIVDNPINPKVIYGHIDRFGKLRPIKKNIKEKILNKL